MYKKSLNQDLWLYASKLLVGPRTYWLNQKLPGKNKEEGLMLLVHPGRFLIRETVTETRKLNFPMTKNLNK